MGASNFALILPERPNFTLALLFLDHAPQNASFLLQAPRKKRSVFFLIPRLKSALDFAGRILYNKFVRRCGGMADAIDSKSPSWFSVSVREIHECALNFEGLLKWDFLHPS